MKFFTFLSSGGFAFSLLVLFAYYFAFKFLRFVYVRLKAHLIHRKLLKFANSDMTDMEKKDD